MPNTRDMLVAAPCSVLPAAVKIWGTVPDRPAPKTVQPSRVSQTQSETTTVPMPGGGEQAAVAQDGHGTESVGDAIGGEAAQGHGAGESGEGKRGNGFRGTEAVGELQCRPVVRGALGQEHGEREQAQQRNTFGEWSRATGCGPGGMIDQVGHGGDQHGQRQRTRNQ